MTLNGAIALILRIFSPNSIALLANYVTVVEDRPIMYAKYCFPVPVFHFWPKLTHPAARSLCESWATCLIATETNRVTPSIFGHSLNEWIINLWQNHLLLDNTTVNAKTLQITVNFHMFIRWRYRLHLHLMFITRQHQYSAASCANQSATAAELIREQRNSDMT